MVLLFSLALPSLTSDKNAVFFVCLLVCFALHVYIFSIINNYEKRIYIFFNLSGLCLDVILAGNFNCYIILIHMNQKYLWFILRLTSKEVRDEAVESSEIFSFLSEFCRWITLQHLLQNHYMWYKFDNIHQCHYEAKLFIFYELHWDTHITFII